MTDGDPNCLFQTIALNTEPLIDTSSAVARLRNSQFTEKRLVESLNLASFAAMPPTALRLRWFSE